MNNDDSCVDELQGSVAHRLLVVVPGGWAGAGHIHALYRQQGGQGCPTTPRTTREGKLPQTI